MIIVYNIVFFAAYLNSFCHAAFGGCVSEGVLAVSIEISDSRWDVSEAIFWFMNMKQSPLDTRVTTDFPEVAFDCDYEDGSEVKLTQHGTHRIDRGRAWNLFNSVHKTRERFVPFLRIYNLREYFQFESGRKCRMVASLKSKTGDVVFSPLSFLPK